MSTGYDWDAAWTPVLTSIQLTEGGTIVNTGETAEIDLDTKAACLLSITASYSNDLLSGTGLVMSVRRDVNDTIWETAKAASLSWEVPFTINADVSQTIALDAGQFQKFVIQGDWSNDTAGSIVTYDVKVKYAVIPAA